MAEKLTIGRSYNFTGALWSGTFTQTFTLRFVPDGYGKPMTLNRLTLPIETYQCSSIIISATSGQSYFTISITTTEIPPQSHIFTSNGNNLEFYNAKLNQITGGYTDSGNALLLQRFTEIFGITLYNLTGEKHLVDKSSYLSNATMMNGQLTEDCDILNPSLLIQHPQIITFNGAENNFTWNYCYIPLFKRYYFITKITSVRNQIWRIDLHVDVLYSYSDDIYLQDVFLERNSLVYNNYSVDERRLLLLEPIYTIVTSTDTGTNVNAHFYTDKDDMISNINTFTSTRCFNIAMSKISDLNAAEQEITLKNSNKLSRKYFSELSLSCVALDLTEYKVLYNAIKDNEPLKSYIASVVLYPFNIGVTEGYISAGGVDNREYFKIGDKQIKMDGTIETWQPPAPTQLDNYVCDFGIQTNLSHELIIADFTVSTPYSSPLYLGFLNYEPYSQYELWIPYCAWIKLPASQILGKRIIVYYNVDYTTGNATAYVKRTSDGMVLYSSPCQLGTRISLSSTNEYENSVRRNANTNNMLLGLLGSAVTTAVGVATENPIAVAGGVLSATKSVVSKVQQDAMTFDRANATLSDSVSGVYNSQKVILKITSRQPISTDETIYANLNGYPSNDYRNLTSGGGIKTHGYSELTILHYTPSSQTWITTTEIDEIENLASKGIIL